MDALMFFKAWVDFVEFNWSVLGGLWQDDKKWTEAAIGAPRSEGANSPLGDHLGMRYWKEDRNVDLALSGLTNFTIRRFPDDGDAVTGQFYPVAYDVLLEHEAAGSISWEEMVKLIQMRARLKVLITYTWDQGGKVEPPAEDSDRLMLYIRETFQTLLQEASGQVPEDPRTQYLLIVGRKEDGRVHWHFHVFDPMGRALNDGTRPHGRA